MTEINEEIKERACNWWVNLDDDERQSQIIEIYCKLNSIPII